MKTSILTAAVTAIVSLTVITASAQQPTKKDGTKQDSTMRYKNKNTPMKADSATRYHHKDSVSTYKKNEMNKTPKTSTN